jgi:hypothetical protein
LAARPSGRLRHLRDAERKLDYARRNREEANWRLENARRELAELGGFSQLRRRGRHEKAALLDRIDRFEDDVRGAGRTVASSEARVEECRHEFAREVAWEVHHGWRTERLDEVEAELADIQGDHRRPDRSLPGLERPDALLRCRSSEPPGREPRIAAWERRLADIAAPPFPGRDAGRDVGPDLGL